MGGTNTTTYYIQYGDLMTNQLHKVDLNVSQVRLSHAHEVEDCEYSCLTRLPDYQTTTC